MKTSYLKVPIELAEYALRASKYRQVQVYLSGLLLFPGKAHTDSDPVHNMAAACGTSERSVYRHFEWLMNKNWIGKDERTGWVFFRGLDRVHHLEGWGYGRAAILKIKDLKSIKGFFAGAVMASLARTQKGMGRRTDRKTPRSGPTAAPISLSVLQNTLIVSKATAYRLRKLAEGEGYIRSEQNLIRITNWTPSDLKRLRSIGVDSVPVELLGYSDRRITPIDRIRYKDNRLFLQGPNMIKSLVQLKVRRGLYDSAPMESTNGIQ